MKYLCKFGFFLLLVFLAHSVFAIDWTTGGSKSWYVESTSSGVQTFRSGAITHSQSTWLQIAVTGPTTVTFQWKVGSEANYDKLTCAVDGATATSIDTNPISGSVDWNNVTLNVASGSHTVKWTYAKDGSVSTSPDAGWVRNITIQKPTVFSTSENSDGTLTITGATPEPTGTLSIPATINGKSVTVIGEDAFYNCSGLTAVTIPYGVTNIGRYAFYSCGLTTMTIPNGVASIGARAFYYCSSLQEVTIPPSVRSIGEGAFYSCGSLKRVNISNVDKWSQIAFASGTSTPTYYAKDLYVNGSLLRNVQLSAGITHVGDYAFYNCESLESVVLPDGVTSIGKSSFNGCSGLTSIRLPNSLRELGVSCFYECSCLGTISLPEGLETIGNVAFCKSGLVSIVVPKSVQFIGRGVFQNCNSLVDVTLPFVGTTRGESSYNDDRFGAVFAGSEYAYPNQLVPESLRNVTITDDALITGAAFSECKGLSSIVLNAGVKTIQYRAFEGCTNLSLVAIGEGVVSIGNYAFKDCYQLTEVLLPDGVTELGGGIFDACTNLRTVSIPSTVETISGGIFANCGQLTDIDLCGNPRYEIVCDCLIRKSDGMMVAYCRQDYTLEIPTVVTSIGPYAFYGSGKLSILTIPETVTNICEYAFSGYRPIYSLKIPDSVVAIAHDAFRDAVPLSKIEFGKGLRTVGADAFKGCTELASICISNIDDWAQIEFANAEANPTVRNTTGVVVDKQLLCNGVEVSDVVLSDAVKSIGAYAFFGYSSLRSVFLPASIERIGTHAFAGCSSISVAVEDAGRFAGIDFASDLANPLYASSTKALYQEGEVVTEVVVPGSVGQIGSYAFDGYKPLTSVIIEPGVTSICDYAFYNCNALTDLRIPVGVESIGNDAFYGCSGLAGLEFPASLKTIGDCAFYGCTGLTKIVIPDGVTVLGGGVFYGCSSLVSITLPDSISEIGAAAFRECTSLVSMVLPSCLESVEDYIFHYCTSLVSVRVPKSVTSIGRWAFGGCTSLRTVNMPQAVTHVGRYAFSGTPIENECSTDIVMWGDCVLGLKYGSTITSVVLPQGTRVIADGAFYGNSTIQCVSMPNTLRGVGNEAFYECSKLQSIAFPEGVDYIGDYALYNCDNLTTVSIPGSVNHIGASALSSCDWLESVSLGEGIETIGEHAFYNAGYQRGYKRSEAIAINIPSTVKAIGSWAFYGLGYKYAAVTVPDIAKWCEMDFTDNRSVPWYYSYGGKIDHLVWDKSNRGILKIPYGPERISAYAFADWKRAEIYIPSSVRKIEGYAFEGSYVEVLRIPSSVIEIGNYAFYSCKYLKTIYVDEGAADRARELMRGKGVDVDTLNFVEVEPVRYTITLDDGLGGDPGTMTMVEGALLVDNLPMLSAKSAVFLGWFTAAEGGEVVLGDMRALSDVSLYAHWERKTVVELLSQMCDVALSGDAEWYADSVDGKWVLRSGTIGSSQTSVLSATVHGKGTLSFKWKVNSETGIDRGRIIPYDEAVFMTGDVTKEFFGNEDWTEVSVMLGEGEHLLSWKFVKDTVDENWVGEDCVWLCDVVWTPVDPFDVGDDLTSERIAEALRDAADVKLTENLDESNYNAFRGWAVKVKDGSGSAAGAQTVKGSPNAWVSFALGQDVLLETPPTDENLTVEEFVPSAEAGKFDFTISVKDIEVGSEAAAENLKKVFGLEGGSSLQGLSSDNVDIVFGAPEDGKVKFSAGPKDKEQTTFFMKVKLVP